MPEEKITEEQATEALQQLAQREEETTQAAPAEPSPAQQVETATEEVQTQTEEAAPDDLDSLKARLAELESSREADQKRYEERLSAQQERASSNDRILRDRYLRKAAIADRALKTLRQTRSESGVSEEDVDRVIRDLEGTMNPESSSYVPPPQPTLMNQPATQAGLADVQEEQALVINSFLNEKGMTVQEQQEFEQWVRNDAVSIMSPAEQAVAYQSLDGFLRLAHGRWQEGVREKTKQANTDNAVAAVQSVQRTQREAARAASGAPRAPQKQPATQGDEVDLSKLTPEDISELARQSVEQHR